MTYAAKLAAALARVPAPNAARIVAWGANTVATIHYGK